jgi:hypothetical protein
MLHEKAGAKRARPSAGVVEVQRHDELGKDFGAFSDYGGKLAFAVCLLDAHARWPFRYWLSLNYDPAGSCRLVYAARRAILSRRAGILYDRCTLRRRLVRTLALLVVFGALAVVAVSYMLQRPSNLPLVEPSPRTGSNPQPLAPAEQPEAASEHVDGAAPGTSRPVPLAPVDDPAARLAARLEPLIGERIAADLQEGGLSKVDSERIAADGSKQFAECVKQAMNTPGVLTETPANADALQDRMDAIGAKLVTCQLNTAQQVGIPHAALLDALRSALADGQIGAKP